jgi:serine/threonine-protein kinase
MGIVYEGFDPLISRRVALKTFRSEFFDGTQSDNLLTRLRREAQAAGRLNHPNVIAVYDYGEDVVKDAAGNQSTTAFIAMEFVEGRSLENYFEAHERFPLGEVQRIMTELLDALQYSHTHGVVHRDIKPANIILLADGSVKVGDFGVARIESSTLTQVGTVLGSPSYMSPEQFMGQTVDGRSDLYSAGVVLYQLLTGEVPFAGGGFTAIMHRVLNDSPPPPTALNVQVPRAFDGLLQRAMAKRPDERFQSAAEFKQAVENVSMSGAGAALAGAAGLPGAALGAAPETMLRSPNAPGVPPRAAGAPAAPAARRAMSPAMLFTVLGVLLVGAGAAYYYWGMRGASGARSASDATIPPPQTTSPPPSTSPPLATNVPASAPSEPVVTQASSTVISAVGSVRDSGSSQDSAAAVAADARQQLIAKAAALYVQPSSLNANYTIVKAKLLAHSDDYITTVLEQPTPQTTQTTQDGVTYGTLRATVSVRDVQKTLNQISHDERVDFIRNHGDPRIAVNVRIVNPDADPSAGAQPSPAAENLLKERIRSFGFAVVDGDQAKPPADFRVDGEVRFKKLSARLAASGLTIEKFVITSWTVKAVDAKTGEEIYHNTAIPEKQSWATQELALADVGRLIGAEFSQNFFLQYFDFKPKRARLRFSGLPSSAANNLLNEVDGSLVVLNAAVVPMGGSDIVIDADVSAAGNAELSSVVQQSILVSLNRKMGANCFSLLDAGTVGSELHIAFDTATCGGTLNRLDSAPPPALSGAPTSSI